MLANERQNEILEYLKEKKSATVAELSRRLFVSEATVRRDLIEMQKLGLLERRHGGAICLETADEISIFVRMTENAGQKELAATNALKYIPEFKSVFLDSSSTVLALALRLDLAHKTVMTNNLQTALQLSKISGINLLIPGGNILPASASVMGSWTNTLLKEFHFDLMLSSCAAVTDKAAYENSIEQRDIKRTAFAHSDCKILICDRSKLTKKGTYLYQPLTEFNLVIFDKLTDAERISFQGVPLI